MEMPEPVPASHACPALHTRSPYTVSQTVLRLGPAEPSGSAVEALQQPAVVEGDAGVGVFAGFVASPQLDRVQAVGFGEFVHRDISGEHACLLVGRAASAAATTCACGSPLAAEAAAEVLSQHPHPVAFEPEDRGHADLLREAADGSTGVGPPQYFPVP